MFGNMMPGGLGLSTMLLLVCIRSFKENEEKYKNNKNADTTGDADAEKEGGCNTKTKTNIELDNKNSGNSTLNKNMVDCKHGETSNYNNKDTTSQQ